MKCKVHIIVAGVIVCSFIPLLTTSAICNTVLPLLDEKGCMPRRLFFLKGDVPSWPKSMKPTLSVQIVVGLGRGTFTQA